MFTIKFYGHDGRRLVRSADSFTILSDEVAGAHEVTLHRKNGDDCRIDVGVDVPRQDGWPPLMSHAFIMNEEGKTVDVLRSGCRSTAPN